MKTVNIYNINLKKTVNICNINLNTWHGFKVNRLNLPVNLIESMDDWNNLIDWLESSDLHEGTILTKSGGISIQGLHGLTGNFRKNINSYYIKQTEITVVLSIYGSFRCRFITGTKEQNIKGSGATAIRYFENELNKENIKLKDFLLDSNVAKEVKKSIPDTKHDLKCVSFKNKVFTECNHIDINSAFPAGLAIAFPVFKNAINKMYDIKQEEKKIGKCDMKLKINSLIGMMQSSKLYQGNHPYGYAHLAKAAIDCTNIQLDLMTTYLEKTNRTILLYNVDGIWFKGEPIKYDENTELFGDKLGQFKQDHKNCKFRAISGGSYEFIEDDKYYPVCKGPRALDSIKPRTEWEWGDIYKDEADIIECYKIDNKTHKIEKIIKNFS